MIPGMGLVGRCSCGLYLKEAFTVRQGLCSEQKMPPESRKLLP